MNFLNGNKPKVEWKAIRAGIVCIVVILSITLPGAAVQSFPSAEGFGTNTVGGRGGRVIEVTHLADKGPGSLRAAVEASGPRTVVFRTGGTIELQSQLKITNPFITIAGQTAPGGGIAIKNGLSTSTSLFLNKVHDVIIRHIRVRPGSGGQPDGIGIFGDGAYNIILDHCSVSWGIDENISCFSGQNEDGPHNISIQWCISSEGLNCSTHDKGCHSKGMMMGGPGGSYNISVHHNLLAHSDQRNPAIGSTGSKGANDFVNNVIYNYGHFAAMLYAQFGPVYVNCVGNYFKKGADSHADRHEFHIYKEPVYAYVKGNIGPHRSRDDMDDLLVIDGWAPPEHVVSIPHPAPTIHSTTALDALDRVLARAGALHGLDEKGNLFERRDAVDARIVKDVKNGTGRIIDDPAEVGGWPVLASGVAYADTDHDGMADPWEQIYFGNLDRGIPSSSQGDFDGDGYTDLEEFLNGTHPLVKEGTSMDSVAVPTISPDGATLPSPTASVTVTLSTNTADASIFYTTDGSSPTTASTPYTAPFELTYSQTTTLKAKAFKDGMNPSPIASATFQIAGAALQSLNGVNLLAYGGTAPEGASLSIASVGGTYYTDRTYTFVEIPSAYDGGVVVQYANDDKTATMEDFITLSVDEARTIVVAYRKGSTIPSWLTEWNASGEVIKGQQIEAEPLEFEVYTKNLSAGETTVLGGNRAGGGNAGTGYIVVVSKGSTNLLPLVSSKDGGRFSLSFSYSRNGLNFLVHLAQPGNFLVTLHDVTGQVLWQESMRNAKTGTHHLSWEKLDGKLKNGAYLVTVQQGQRKSMHRVLMVR